MGPPTVAPPAPEEAQAPAAMGAGTAGVAAEYYANHELRHGDRHEQWRGRMAGMFEIPPPDAGKPDDYLIEARRWMLPGMLLVSASYPDMQMVRERHHIRRDQFDHYVVSVRRSGPMRLEADGVAHETGLMRPVLTDMARPSSFSWHGGEGLSLFVHRDTLDALLPRPLDLHGFAPHGITATLLADHLQMLERHLPGLSSVEAQGVKAATMHLLAASVAPSLDSLGLARPTLDMGLVRLIRQHVERHLCDPDLSADSLCRQFGVSRSTLYRVMDPLGGVAHYVRERRLARCHAILNKPGERHYIERIAEDHGFRSATQFSRAFREQFGYAPREAAGQPAPVVGGQAGAPAAGSDFRSSLEALGR